jgi:hypothetical protein
MTCCDRILVIMKNALTIVVFALFLSGCNTLAHMDQLLVLKGIGDEQAAIDQDVAQENKRFDKLFAAAQKDNFIKDYPTKKKIVGTFGEPVFLRPETKNGQPLEFALYRRAKEFFNQDKVHLYFDEAGHLASYEVFKKQETTAK